jgi:hypothetical protein
VLNELVEHLSNVRAFAPRSKSAFLFQSLSSLSPELSRSFRLDTQGDLNCIGCSLALLSSSSLTSSSARAQRFTSMLEITAEASLQKKCRVDFFAVIQKELIG